MLAIYIDLYVDMYILKLSNHASLCLCPLRVSICWRVCAAMFMCLSVVVSSASLSAWLFFSLTDQSQHSHEPALFHAVPDDPAVTCCAC
jgi:hypothetical protein